MVSAALSASNAAAGEPKPDAAWNFKVSCISGVWDCASMVALALADLSERFPAETHRIVALSNALENGAGQLMTAAWIGISPALPGGTDDDVLLPGDLFSAMAVHEPPAGGRFSRREIEAAEAATLGAAVRSMVKECRRTPECANTRE
jgi:hypothetical protein